MKMVRGRAEARLMPSRHAFALFQLAAYLRLRRAQRKPVDAILVIAPYQSNVETYVLSIYFALTVAACLAGTLFATLPFPIALTLATIVSILGIQATLVASGVLLSLWQLLTRITTDSVKVNSIMTMSAIFALGAYCATRTTWVRFAGRQLFAIAALNVLAALIVFLLREPIARLEASVGGMSSAQ
jgi:hypothetical protein